MRLARALFQTMVLLALAITANPQSAAGGMRSTPIGVGDVAPDFTLADQNGHTVTLSDSRGKSSVVLVFYRGYW